MVRQALSKQEATITQTWKVRLAGRQVEECMARQACRVPKAVRPAGKQSGSKKQGTLGGHGTARNGRHSDRLGGWARVAGQRSSEGRWTGQCRLAGMPGKEGWH